MKVKVKTLKNTLTLYIVIVFSIILYYLIRKSYIVFDEHSFIDYLINYQDGGFKRRGLIGTLSLIINNTTGISLSSIVFTISTVPYIVISLIFVKYIKVKAINRYSIITLVSPICLGFYLNNYQAIGRKESLVIATFGVFTYLYDDFKNSMSYNIIISIVISLLVLAHELTFLYLAYFVLFQYVKEEKFNYKNTFHLVLLPTIAFVIILLSGTDIERGGTKAMLLEKGIVISRIGILDWNEKEFKYFKYISEYFWGYMLYVIPLLFTSYFSIKSIYDKILHKRILTVYILAFAFSFPLFMTAIDWGRWVHIHSMMQLLVVFPLLQNDKREIININTNKMMIILMLLISMLFIKVKHIQRALSYKTIFVELFMKSINKNYPHNSDTLGY